MPQRQLASRPAEGDQTLQAQRCQQDQHSAAPTWILAQRGSPCTTSVKNAGPSPVRTWHRAIDGWPESPGIRARPALPDDRLSGPQTTGLLNAAEATSSLLRQGVDRQRTALMTLASLTLLREPGAQGTTRIVPADLGRILALDRARKVHATCRLPFEREKRSKRLSHAGPGPPSRQGTCHVHALGRAPKSRQQRLTLLGRLMTPLCDRPPVACDPLPDLSRIPGGDRQRSAQLARTPVGLQRQGRDALPLAGFEYPQTHNDRPDVRPGSQREDGCGRDLSRRSRSTRGCPRLR